MHGAAEGGQCVEGVGEDIAVLFFITGLVPHEFLRGDPAAVSGIAFQSLWTKKKAEAEVRVGVFVLALFNNTSISIRT